jgi:8-oxo-dGTP pyrophosphatase MutT (NUDIX family)
VSVSTDSFDAALFARARANLDRFERRSIVPDGRRPAAVALVLLPDDLGRSCFLITRRAKTLRAHAGQWALPGGRIDEGESPERAVRRELEEEVGLTLGGDAVLGVLDDYGTRSGFIITPVVVWAERVADLIPNPAEVAGSSACRWPIWICPTCRASSAFPSERPVIQLPLMGSLIHAPTAAVVFQMREVVLHGRPTRVDHLEQPVWAWR